MARRTIRRTRVLAAAAILTLGVSACSAGNDSGTKATNTSGGGGKKTISFVSAFNSALYFQDMKCGAEKAAKEQGVNLDWTGPAQWDVQQQVPMINAATQTSPDGLIVVPTDPKALISPIKQATNRGIIVITVDGSLDQKVELQNIRTDNKEAGAKAGEAIDKLIGGQGSILVVGLAPGVVANQERIDGFAEVIKRKSSLKLLPTQYSQGDQGKAAQIVTAAIQANPNLKAIYTTLAPASAGAASAIEASGKKGAIKLVAYDADPSQVKQLKDGTIDALVAQEPNKEGYQAVTTLAKVLKGETKKDSLTYQEHTSAFVITRENADSDEAKAHIYSASCR